MDTAYAFMSDSQEAITRFVDACNDLQHTAYILADAKISELLKSVAASTKIYSLFADITKGFDFQKCFQASMYAYGENRFILNYPKDKSQFLCFVLALLLKLDMREMELHRFLTTYYYSPEGINDSFKTFCKEVVGSFKTCVQELIG